jgi:hypothetical protein
MATYFFIIFGKNFISFLIVTRFKFCCEFFLLSLPLIFLSLSLYLSSFLSPNTVSPHPPLPPSLPLSPSFSLLPPLPLRSLAAMNEFFELIPILREHAYLIDVVHRLVQSLTHPPPF